MKCLPCALYSLYVNSTKVMSLRHILITASGDAIVIIDKSGTISWYKPSFAGKDEISEQLNKVGSGGSYNSISSLLGLILIAGIPGIFYALPNLSLIHI